MNKKVYAVIVLLIFAVISNLHEVLGIVPGISQLYRGLYDAIPYPLPGELRSLFQIVLIFISIMILSKSGIKNSIKDTGLIKPVLPAFLFGIIATSPMWIVFGVSVPFAEDFQINTIFYLAFLSPFAEETVFRGFGFGQIRRKAGLGFWSAAILTAVVFGLGHISISRDISQTAGIFLITGLGGILFAWLYEKWDYNLWVPFWLHCFMNLNWQIFDVGNSAFAGWLPTLMQLTVAVLAIVLTVFRNKIDFFTYVKAET